MQPFDHPRVGDRVMVPGVVVDMVETLGATIAIVEVPGGAHAIAPMDDVQYVAGGWDPPDLETKAG
jgi:hypothetical protein